MRLVGLLLLALLPAVASAQHCGAVSYQTYTPSYAHSYGHNYHYATATYYQPYYYQPYYPQLFTVGYSPPGTPDLEKDLLKLKLELKDLTIDHLKLKLDRPTPVPAAPQPPVQAPAPAPNSFGSAAPAALPGTGTLQIFAARCASCHDEAKAKDSGGGLTLLRAGKVADLSAAQKLAVISATFKGTMPKGGKALSDDEVSLLVKELSGN